MRRRENRWRRRKRYGENEDLNPMNFVSNLSDVMLILAVGIMLALVIHWNVKISTPEETSQGEKKENTIAFDESDLSGADEVPDDLDKMGEVFYDPDTGKYYIITDDHTGDETEK